MTQPETYTRDSDGKRFKEQELFEKTFGIVAIKPIEENPMPEILPGDHIVSVSGEKCYFLYYTQNEAFSNGMTYYVGERKEHWRNGIRIWEAKK